MSKNSSFCPPYKTYNMISQPRTQTYTEWFSSYIFHNNYNSDDTTTYNATHGTYIKYFYDHIIKILETNRMNITNEKEFNLLTKSQFRQKIANSISNGVLNYIKQSN